MSSSLPFHAAESIHRILDYSRLIDALRDAFRHGAEVPPRHVHTVAPAEDGRLLLMPAWRAQGAAAAIGVKIVTVFPGNIARGVPTVGALYLVLDGKTGHPVALLDGEALTSRRTAAASALASTYLSRPDSRTLLVVGTGQLAPFMVAAHRRVRPIERVLVWGRDRDKAARLATALADMNAEPIDDLAAGVARADIVTCATTSRVPIVTAAMSRPGTHFDLVGGFTPAMREVDDALIDRATLFVDTFAGALAEAGDLVQPIQRGVITRERVVAELADLVCGRHAGRADEREITLFKSVGTALEDLAAAQLVVLSEDVVQDEHHD